MIMPLASAQEGQIEEFDVHNIGDSNRLPGIGAQQSEMGITQQVQQFANDRGLTGLRPFSEVGTGPSRLRVLGSKEGQFLIVLQTPIKTFCHIATDVYAAGQVAMALSFLTNRVANVGAGSR